LLQSWFHVSAVYSLVILTELSAQQQCGHDVYCWLLLSFSDADHKLIKYATCSKCMSATQRKSAHLHIASLDVREQFALVGCHSTG
jgi:hypothetical protein